MRRIKQGIFNRSECVLGFTVLCFALAAGTSARAHTVPQTQELERLIYSVKGPELFRAHCAACHGEAAKGDGPVASALKAKVPDLTVLARKFHRIEWDQDLGDVRLENLVKYLLSTQQKKGFNSFRAK